MVESGQLLRVGTLIIRSKVPNNALLPTTDSLAENKYCFLQRTAWLKISNYHLRRRNHILPPNKYSWEYLIDRLSVVSRDTRSQNKSGVRPGIGISNTKVFMKSSKQTGSGLITSLESWTNYLTARTLPDVLSL